MKRKSIILFTVIFFMGATASNNKTDERNATKAPLLLIIESDQRFYRLNEPIMIDVKVINKENEIYMVYHRLEIGFELNIKIFDSNGKEIEYHSHGLIPARLNLGLADFIYLDMNKYFGDLYNINAIYRDQLSRGKYRIKAVFDIYPSIVERLTESRDADGNVRKIFWSGTLESNEIWIYIW